MSVGIVNHVPFKDKVMWKMICAEPRLVMWISYQHLFTSLYKEFCTTWWIADGPYICSSVFSGDIILALWILNHKAKNRYYLPPTNLTRLPTSFLCWFQHVLCSVLRKITSNIELIKTRATIWACVMYIGSSPAVTMCSLVSSHNSMRSCFTATRQQWSIPAL